MLNGMPTQTFVATAAHSAESGSVSQAISASRSSRAAKTCALGAATPRDATSVRAMPESYGSAPVKKR